MKNARSLILILAAAALVAAAGCDTKPLPNGAADPASITCTSCHGSNGIPAPPPEIDGKTETTAAGVGAHRTHVEGGALKRPVECKECHTVPATVDAPGHIDGVVDIAWGQLARTDGANPAFDPVRMTCSNVYCHGVTLPGGSNKSPQWTKVDGTQAACGTCHGAPPPSPHPQNTTCATCHPDPLTAGKHINGVIDRNSDTLTCTSCHGNAATGAANPPIGTGGETKTTQAAVGAHQKHLGPSTWHRAGECTDCHAIPNSLEHADGKIDFAWGGPAAADGAAPAYDEAKGTCSSVYCHGTTLFGPAEGGTINRTPIWTKVDETFNACGKTCHTNPPGGKHPKSDKCGNCHQSVVDADLNFINPQLHIDGTVEVSANACNVCHGNATNAAPPVSTSGSSATTDVAVGAHQSHLTDNEFRAAIACSECHVVPASMDSPGHRNGTVEIAWGALAISDGAAPEWDHTTATCSAVYCHGTTLDGGTVNKPVWTKVDGTQAVCGSCHGIPPPPPHPARTDCHECHGGTVKADGTIDVAAGLHIDGVVENDATCRSCHGSADNNAPPIGTHGESQTADHAVGAHQKHLGTSAWHRDVQCDDCHVVPQSIPHDNGQVDFAWSAVATGKGAKAPAYDTGAFTCAAVHCHGPNKGGGGNNTPKWTTVDGTQAACGTCHGTPPPSPHPQTTVCESCHPSVISSFTPGTPPTAVWTDRTLHIDGEVEVSWTNVTCRSCHGSAQNAAPPVSTSGASATTDVAVGAHQSHLTDNEFRAAVACTECHVVPASVNAPGHLDGKVSVTFGTLAGEGPSSPSWDHSTATCSSVYCHGATLPGGTVTKPVWTKVDGTQAACGTCHGLPPPPPHPVATDCSTCHAQTVKADGTIDVAGGKHIDGQVEVSWTNLTCHSCHGNAQNAAPPLSTSGTSATTDVAVGAHQSHLTDNEFRAAVACTECHVVPASIDSPGHRNGTAEIAWGALATSEGAAPEWDHTAATCSAAYCHGATLDGGTVTKPVWTKVDGTQAACGTCHGLPPPPPHPVATDCSTCHAQTVKADGTIDVAGGKHIDGQVEVSWTNLTCHSCHGNAQNAAPPLSTSGTSATTDVAVGAHQSHLSDGSVRKAIDCAECHNVPQTVDDPLHRNGSVEITWGPLAKSDGAAPQWDHTTATCSVVYCHGATLPGGTVTKPVWTKVDGTQALCSSCHGFPPPPPHPAATDCWTCHAQTVKADGTIDVAGGKHIDGDLQITWTGLTCTSCHGNAQNAAPPGGTHGETETSAPAVGAHQQHLATSAWHRDVQCDDCHAVPTDTQHSNGKTDFAWSIVATGYGATSPDYDDTTHTCTSVSCHGPAKGGGSNNAPLWTKVDGTQAACGTCHDLPPPSPHPQNTGCQLCHGSVISSFTPGSPPTAVWYDKNLHITGFMTH